MKKAIAIAALVALLAGCVWSNDAQVGASFGTPGSTSEVGRGTTGVSTGADAGAATPITGSDVAPKPGR